jgi:hypothetical protein
MRTHEWWVARPQRAAATLALVALALMAFLTMMAGCGSSNSGVDPTTTLPPLATQGPQLYPVTVAGGAMGYVDKTGKMILPAQYAEAAPFSEGLAAVRLQAFGLWGYIDRSGKTIIEPQFADASPFSEGLAAIRVDVNGAWGFTDTAGALAMAPRFADASQFSEGLARVRVGQESGYVDTKGEWVIRLSQLEAVSEFSGGLAQVFDRNSSVYGYIDAKGDVAIVPVYADAWGFSEDLAAVRLPTGPNLFGYIDKHGKWIIQPRFAGARPFSEGLAAVQSSSDGMWGYVDATGAEAIRAQWDAAEEFDEGVARVGLIVGDADKAGQMLWGYAYIGLDGKVIWRDQALAAFEAARAAGVTTTTAPDPTM